MLSSIISKLQGLTYSVVGYNTFTKLFATSVMPILDYASVIWVLIMINWAKGSKSSFFSHFLGVHKSAPINGLHEEKGWLNIKYHYDLCKLCY